MAHAAQNYYFNVSRWVWTGKSTLLVTWANIRSGDWQGITVSKVAKIALLFIPAFVFDLLRMAVGLCLPKRQVVVQQALPPRLENTSLLERALSNPETQARERHLLPLALSFLDSLEARRLFAQNDRLEGFANSYRGHGDVDDETLAEIQSFPNASCILRDIRSLKCTREMQPDAFHGLIKQCKSLTRIQFPRFMDSATIGRALELLDVSKITHVSFFGVPFSDAEFLELIRRFPNLKSFEVPCFSIMESHRQALVSEAAQIQAIEILQHRLEEIVLAAAGDGIVEALTKCPNFTGLEISRFRGVDPNQASLMALAEQGKLKKFKMSSPRGIRQEVLRAIQERCPLEHFSCRFGVLFGLGPLGAVNPANWLSNLISIRWVALLNSGCEA